MNITIEFYIFEIALVPNFSLNWQFWFFGPNLPKKGIGYFQSKTEKVSITIEFCIFELVQVPNFNLNWQFWFFGPNLPQKKYFVVKTKKSEHNDRTLHVRISQGTKFQLKMKILIFWTNLAQKGISGLNQRKWTWT